jgi:hypothetical protein
MSTKRNTQSGLIWTQIKRASKFQFSAEEVPFEVQICGPQAIGIIKLHEV